jgi:hypothetical protein
LGALTLAALAFAGLVSGALTGCGTDAVGVDVCREIEGVRCEAMEQCGALEGSVAACKRFYRDQCLHGLKLKKEPLGSDVDGCKSALTAAGDCAQRSGADTPIASCKNRELSRGSSSRVKDVCDAVKAPELITACAFLAPAKSPEPEPGGAGAAGAPGDSDGEGFAGWPGFGGVPGGLWPDG